MVEIKLDSEPVTFDGPAPGSLEEIFSVILKYLDGHGKVISKFMVDGEEVPTTERMESKGSMYKRVEIISMERSEFFLNGVKKAVREGNGVTSYLEEFSVSVLSRPWSESVVCIGELMEKTLPVIQILEVAVNRIRKNRVEWLEESIGVLKEFGEVINLYTSAAALKDPACLSDIVGIQMLPLIKQALNLLQGPISSYFETTSPDYEAPAS